MTANHRPAPPGKRPLLDGLANSTGAVEGTCPAQARPSRRPFVGKWKNYAQRSPAGHEDAKRVPPGATPAFGVSRWRGRSMNSRSPPSTLHHLRDVPRVQDGYCAASWRAAGRGSVHRSPGEVSRAGARTERAGRLAVGTHRAAAGRSGDGRPASRPRWLFSVPAYGRVLSDPSGEHGPPFSVRPSRRRRASTGCGSYGARRCAIQNPRPPRHFRAQRPTSTPADRISPFQQRVLAAIKLWRGSAPSEASHRPGVAGADPPAGGSPGLRPRSRQRSGGRRRDRASTAVRRVTSRRRRSAGPAPRAAYGQ